MSVARRSARNERENRILVRRRLIVEVDAGDEAREDPARENAEQKMRCLQRIVRTGHAARHHGLDHEASIDRPWAHGRSR